MLTLVLGGARSGKSRFAQSLAESAEHTIYLATAAAPDDSADAEMVRRIRRHKEDRPLAWTTVEEPLEIVSVVRENAAENTIILIDCVTLWLSNLMWEYRTLSIAERENTIFARVNDFAETAVRAAGIVIAVSNEVGGGIVPSAETAREFRDLQGFVNQLIAARAEKVYFVAAGLPVVLKS